MTTLKCQVGIPVYASTYLPKTKQLAVAGGGGEGRHGVENKVVLLSATKAGLAVSGEHVFPVGDDTPMSIASGVTKDGSSDFVATGVNYARSAIKSGSNAHLRVLVHTEGEIRQASATGVFQSVDPEIYQRATAVSPVDSSIALATSEDHAHVYIVPAFDPADKKEQHSISLEESVQDLSFSPDGKLLAVCGPRSVVIVDVSSGQIVANIPTPPKKNGPQRAWSRCSFTSPAVLIVAANVGNRLRATLHGFEIQPGKDNKFSVREFRTCTVPRNAKAVTALASDGNLVAVGTPGGDVFVFNTNLKRVAVYKGHHGFPITSVAVTDDRIASTSLDGTVIEISDVGRSGGISGTVGWVLASSLVILIVSILAAWFWEYQIGDLSLRGSSNAPHTAILSSTSASESTTIYDRIIEDRAHQPHAYRPIIENDIGEEIPLVVEEFSRGNSEEIVEDQTEDQTGDGAEELADYQTAEQTEEQAEDVEGVEQTEDQA